MKRSLSLALVILHLWTFGLEHVVEALAAQVPSGSIAPEDPPDNIPSAELGVSIGATQRFAVFAIPANALGDMDNNGLLNILDLLRLRNIGIGEGGPPSQYEIEEGDLNGDGRLDSADALYVQDVLLQRRGLPHIIDSLGGQVIGNGGRTTFTIPPGAYFDSKRMAVENLPLPEFEERFGLSVSSLGQGVAYMAGAKLRLLNPSAADSGALPPGIVMTEAAEAGVDTNGTNAVFNIANDRNGDGFPDLRLLGDLRPDSTLTSVSYRVNNHIAITELVRVLIDPSSGNEIVLPETVFQPGMFLRAGGSGWESIFPSDYEILWVSQQDTTVLSGFALSPSNPSSMGDVRGIVFPVPFFSTDGLKHFVIHNKASGAMSAPITVTVESIVGVQSPGLRDSILAVFAGMDSVFSSLAADPDIQRLGDIVGLSMSEVTERFRAGVETFRLTPDDSLDPQQLANSYQLVRNGGIDVLLGSSNFFRNHGLRASDPPIPIRTRTCIRNCMLINSFLEILSWSLVVLAPGGPQSCVPLCISMGPIACVLCVAFVAGGIILLTAVAAHLFKKCLESCCPPDYVMTCEVFSTFGGAGGLDFEFVCIHFKWHAIVASPLTGWQCASGCDAYNTRVLFDCSGRFLGGPSGLASDLTPGLFGSAVGMASEITGLIIKVNDSPISISQGEVHGGQTAFIPFNVLSGNLTLSAFEPTTGFFDENVGEVFVTNPFNEAHSVAIDFQPDTTICRGVCGLGQVVTQAITTSCPNREYSLSLTPSEVGALLDCGFRATDALTFIMESPAGSILFNNQGNGNCVNVRNLVVAESGTYSLKIGRGSAGQYGSFTMGSRIDGGPPTSYLCGSLLGALDTSRSPYISADAAVVGTGDSLRVEASVTIEFESGGSIIAQGQLSGMATATDPIILRPRPGTVAEGPFSMLHSESSVWSSGKGLQR